MKNIPTWSNARIAPCICRILARIKGSNGQARLMTDDELIAKTGWGRKRLRSVYRRSTFNGVTNADTDVFHWACGLRPSNQRREVWKLHRAWNNGGIDGVLRMRHLRTALPWQVSQIKRMTIMMERVLKNE